MLQQGRSASGAGAPDMKRQRATQVAPQPMAPSPLHQHNVATLLEMGIVHDADAAAVALKHNMGDLERAINWVFNDGFAQLERRVMKRESGGGGGGGGGGKSSASPCTTTRRTPPAGSS